MFYCFHRFEIPQKGLFSSEMVIKLLGQLGELDVTQTRQLVMYCLSRFTLNLVDLPYVPFGYLPSPIPLT
jgi:hypothetical protein